MRSIRIGHRKARRKLICASLAIAVAIIGCKGRSGANVTGVVEHSASAADSASTVGHSDSNAPPIPAGFPQGAFEGKGTTLIITPQGMTLSGRSSIENQPRDCSLVVRWTTLNVREPNEPVDPTIDGRWIARMNPGQLVGSASLDQIQIQRLSSGVLTMTVTSSGERDANDFRLHCLARDHYFVAGTRPPDPPDEEAPPTEATPAQAALPTKAPSAQGAPPTEAPPAQQVTPPPPPSPVAIQEDRANSPRCLRCKERCAHHESQASRRAQRDLDRRIDRGEVGFFGAFFGGVAQGISEGSACITTCARDCSN